MLSQRTVTEFDLTNKQFQYKQRADSQKINSILKALIIICLIVFTYIVYQLVIEASDLNPIESTKLTNNVQILQPQLSVQIPKASSKSAPRIPITYIWMGEKLPATYACHAAKLKYPHQVVMNPKLVSKFDRQLKDIEAADLARLQYIYFNGGIYADFDNQINYDCLMELVKDKKGAYFTAQSADILNSFMYASQPLLPQVKEVIDSISGKDYMLNFAGCPKVLAFPRLDISSCVKHRRDWSWRKDTGAKENQGWRADWNSYGHCTIKYGF